MPSIRHSIESPITKRVASRQLSISGWCFQEGPDNLRGIRAWVGEEKFVANRKQSRPLVGAMYPETPEADRCGFTVAITLPRGGGAVRLEARDSDGSWQAIETLNLKAPRLQWPAIFPWATATTHSSARTSKETPPYSLWIERHDTMSEQERSRILARIETMNEPPLISIIVPVYNPAERWLQAMIKSVQNQLYPHWELCLADDVSPNPHVLPILEAAAGSDPRIKVTFREKNGHISAASNSALELATGSFMALLDHDDELTEHALFWIAEEILAHPEADILFSDEDKITEKGERTDPYFKPDFNYDLLLSQNSLCHLGVYRMDLIRSIDGFQLGMEGSQDWDLALRAIEHGNLLKNSEEKIRHIPKILYHWRIIPGSTALNNEEKPYASTAGTRAVQQHLERLGQQGVKAEPNLCFVRVIWPLPDPPPPVSLIMPTHNRLDLLQVAVESLLKVTSYPDYELIIVDHDSGDPATLKFLHDITTDSRVRVIPYSGDFNFSKINNFAITHTDRPVIGLLNNDLEFTEKSWLDEMVSQALRPDIGAVAPQLLYPNGQIQHAGVVIGMVSGAGHPFRKSSNPRDTHGGRGLLSQNYSALTAACLLVEQKLYHKVGGLDEGDFKVGLNDIDFCLKLRQAGYRNLYTSAARVIHHESASRAQMERSSAGANRAAGENAALAKKWPHYFQHDPCWNPNLSLLTENGDLAFPPRQVNGAASSNVPSSDL